MHEHSAGAVVFRRTKEGLQYLIVQSVPHHTWGFPKGHLEAGENTRQAARREVHEETALKPKFDYSFLHELTYNTPYQTRKTVTFFLAQAQHADQVRRQLSEIRQTRWVDLKEAMETLSYQGLRDILAKANEFIEQQEKRMR
ncbi:MAG: NUDIX domain-containing protein [Lactobacillus sp.]|jgi:8-oxo-dGTP pyrophosphatase MutT (NUDIX family)|nr:NUDIX domain-containing protein [Lactobacillus sp.]MCH3906142.1 NUDIX domain-containing protein [Lactobacillus sp.]MCH3990281.1 NUDIX domain-containing protein [Lactobacillus sp.]MCH4069005.1 NUDIX domain-containing protein [Lactobacillus sp.]MCI1303407.1 NUDIX domain-containing protein [Lactobacillus sp.]